MPVSPEIEIGEAALISVTVIVFDVRREFLGTLVWSVNVNWSGVVSADSASVVTVKVSVTPPMFSVVFLAVDQLEDEVCLTVTVSPLFTVLLES